MDLKLPKLGEGSDSGVVVNVFVKVGDTIAKDQTIIELENEKAVATIPATAAGVVTMIFVKAGDKITIGQRILSLGESGGAGAGATKASVKRTEPEPEAEATVEVSEDAGDEQTPPRVAAPVSSPSLRRVARELGIDLGKIRGSGSGGRVEMSDVRAYIQRLEKAAAKGKSAGGVPAGAAKPAVESVDFTKWGPVTKKSITPLRQVIARRMWENWNAIPHVTQFDEADFTRLNELRKKFAAAYEAKGAKLTLTPLVLKAVAATLNKHPIFNSSLDEVANEIVLKEYVHLGIAVDT
ncbi:MAG: 2-oxo acid dehydrogenase subunit E2, partial [Verrucomicrobia subdivision 3 bacterium]|nr:2-oxo acid dehydrogenase subunit E2 [Limisphaerales bacterium]